MGASFALAQLVTSTTVQGASSPVSLDIRSIPMLVHSLDKAYDVLICIEDVNHVGAATARLNTFVGEVRSYLSVAFLPVRTERIIMEGNDKSVDALDLC